MKLLIITQKVNINDDLLGFMHDWISEFAKKCELVTVICLEKGEQRFPGNVKVLSLGKESMRKAQIHANCAHTNKLLRFFYKIHNLTLYSIKFYKYIWSERKNYDAVFVHMNHEYVILGGLAWKMIKKKIGLWYAHGYVPKILTLSEKLADYIFTSTNSGFRLISKKIKVVGQGIDIEKFANQEEKIRGNYLKIISVGRIAPAKDYLTLIKAADLLNKAGLKFSIEIIGGVIFAKHENYFKELKTEIEKYGLSEIIKFRGSIPFRDILKYLSANDLFVNMSHTGSLDKVILEAMACELPILTCNEAVNEVLGEYRGMLMYDKGDFQGLAEKIKFINGLLPEKIKKIGKDLRQLVVENHSLSALIDKILFIYEQKN